MLPRSRPFVKKKCDPTTRSWSSRRAADWWWARAGYGGRGRRPIKRGRPLVPPLRGLLLTLLERAENVVVAGGGVVGEDGRQQIGARRPARREVEAATHAQSRAAAAA